MCSITVAMFLCRIDVRKPKTLTPIVPRRSNYLAFAPNFLSGLNGGFGLMGVTHERSIADAQFLGITDDRIPRRQQCSSGECAWIYRVNSCPICALGRI